MEVSKEVIVFPEKSSFHFFQKYLLSKRMCLELIFRSLFTPGGGTRQAQFFVTPDETGGTKKTV